jgi:hypothetical protein
LIAIESDCKEGVHKSSHPVQSLLLFVTELRTRDNIITPRVRVLLDKLTFAKLVNKLMVLHRTRKFIALFTKSCHWSLSRNNPVSICIPHTLRSSLIISPRMYPHPSTISSFQVFVLTACTQLYFPARAIFLSQITLLNFDFL